MSFKEKSNLTTLGVLALVFGAYFGQLGVSALDGNALPGATAGPLFGPVFISLTIAFVIWLIFTHVILASFFAKEADAGADERDRAIETRADAGAGYVLGAGVIATLVLVIGDVSGYWIAHALLGALVAAEAYKGVHRAVIYRVGG